jgi:hypothetical protein
MPSTYAYLVVMSLPELPPLLKRTPIQGSRWSEPRPSVKPVVNNDTVGHGSAPDPNDLNVPSIPLDRIIGPVVHW